MRVLFDVNVLLDIFLNRDPWVAESQPAVQLVLDGKVDGFISAISLTTLYYLMRKTVGSVRALGLVGDTLLIFEVAGVDKSVLLAALQMPGVDFEDHVQLASAQFTSLDAVVTRDSAGFQVGSLLILTPHELVSATP